MKYVLEVCLIAVAFCAAGAQEMRKPVLKKGISVKMPVAAHPVEMRAADAQDATVVVVTEEGKVFVGATPVEIDALSRVAQGTVYVKADARVPYQRVLTVLEALRGRSIVLLTAAPAHAEPGTLMPPYGVSLTMFGQ